MWYQAHPSLEARSRVKLDGCRKFLCDRPTSSVSMRICIHSLRKHITCQKSHVYSPHDLWGKMGTHSSQVACMETGAEWMKPQCFTWKTRIWFCPSPMNVLCHWTHRSIPCCKPRVQKWAGLTHTYLEALNTSHLGIAFCLEAQELTSPFGNTASSPDI